MYMDYQQPQPNQPQNKGYGKGYGKRPLWQWILIYVVVGGIIYGAVYYFAIAKKGGYDASNTTYQNTNSGSDYQYQNVNSSAAPTTPGSRY